MVYVRFPLFKETTMYLWGDRASGLNPDMVPYIAEVAKAVACHVPEALSARVIYGYWERKWKLQGL